MPLNDTNIKKIYNETASVIVDLCFNKRITEPEMYFLLNLLELIWIGGKGNDLIESLINWQSHNNPIEINEIIKQTLLNLDFNDTKSLDEISKMIQELLNA